MYWIRISKGELEAHMPDGAFYRVTKVGGQWMLRVWVPEQGAWGLWLKFDRLFDAQRLAEHFEHVRAGLLPCKEE